MSSLRFVLRIQLYSIKFKLTHSHSTYPPYITLVHFFKITQIIIIFKDIHVTRIYVLSLGLYGLFGLDISYMATTLCKKAFNIAT